MITRNLTQKDRHYSCSTSSAPAIAAVRNARCAQYINALADAYISQWGRSSDQLYMIVYLTLLVTSPAVGLG